MQDDEFLSLYGDERNHGDEYEYFQCVLSVVRSVEFPQNEPSGLALFFILKYDDFKIGKMDAVVNSCSGSDYATSELIAHIFGRMDPVNWRARLWSTSWQENRSLIEFWRNVFKNSPRVERFTE